jgi:hypothetical protein
MVRSGYFSKTRKVPPLPPERARWNFLCAEWFADLRVVFHVPAACA